MQVKLDILSVYADYDLDVDTVCIRPVGKPVLEV